MVHDLKCFYFNFTITVNPQVPSPYSENYIFIYLFYTTNEVLVN